GELTQPDELGLHRNTAFTMGLIHRWGVTTSSPLVDLVHERAIEWWGNPSPRSLSDEPEQHDFLSPALTVADLMSNVLDSGPFAAFLDDLIPGLNSELDSLTPVDCPDPSNGRLSHLQGLNLSRAWMMRSIAASLGDMDGRTNGLLRAAHQHFTTGDAAVTGEHFAGAHWLPTFALIAMGVDLVD
ncbi:MAG: DUF2891 domain-containing protein, partial [Acidimicrobiia bacterium]|nr:DUF2891 domain-containing protein [Acidimicrobiia bacterium]